MGGFRYVSTIKEILKGALLILCVYGATDYAQAQENIDLSNKLAGRNHIYLTHLSLYMTIITLFLSYSVKHFGINSMKEIYRDSLSITLPIEGLVTTTFWVLNYIDPTLLKNKELYLAGVRTPLIGELSLHLLPFILLLADQIGVDMYEKKRHYWIFISAATSYFITIYYFYCLNKCWLYPFLDDMSMISRIISVGFLTSIVLIYYKLSLKLSRFINSLIFGRSRNYKLKLI